jgi:hypothetical protein
VVLKLRLSGSGQMPLQIAYSDLTRRGRFGVTCNPRFDGSVAARTTGRWRCRAVERKGRSTSLRARAEARLLHRLALNHRFNLPLSG